MQEEVLQLDEQGEIYLTHKGKKFWHLKADCISNFTISRVGPLDSNGFEVQSKCVESKPKTHIDLTACLGYAGYHIKLKQEKGYQKNTRKGKNIKRPAQSEFQHPSEKQIKQDPQIGHSGRLTQSEFQPPSEKQIKEDPQIGHSGRLTRSEFQPRSERKIKQDHSKSASADSWGSHSTNRSISSALSSFQSSLNVLKMIFGSQSQEYPSYPSSPRGSATRQTEANTIGLNDDKKEIRKKARTQRRFVGSFLVRKNKEHQEEEFYKIQVLKKHLKIEEGITGEVKMTPQYQTYKNKVEAVNQATIFMIGKLDEGFEIKDDRFKFDFENSEVLTITHALSRQRALQTSNQRAQEKIGEPIITQQQGRFQVHSKVFQKKIQQMDDQSPPPLGPTMSKTSETLEEPTESHDKNPTEGLGRIRCSCQDMSQKASVKYMGISLFSRKECANCGTVYFDV